MAYCLSVDQDFPVYAPERRLYTLVYGEKRAVLKGFTIERKIRGARDQWIENTFEAYLAFDDALMLFFSQVFAYHCYSKVKILGDIGPVWYEVTKKLIRDFNDDLHPKDFTILETGMKLRANLVMPVSNYLPPDSTDLVISGTFEF